MEDGKYSGLCDKVIENAKREIYLNMRFFGMALNAVKTFAEDSGKVVSFATDGSDFFYNSLYLLKYFSEDNSVERAIVHSLLHCFFRHCTKSFGKENSFAWDVSCDIAVESIIDGMNLPVLEREGRGLREDIYSKLTGKVKILNAERIYRALSSLTVEKLTKYANVFYVDDHVLWKRPQDKDEPTVMSFTVMGITEARADAIWEDIAKTTLIDIESFGKSEGVNAERLIKSLKTECAKRYDYKKFLSDFLSLKERVIQSPDEFDYIYYCYGLSLYDNMPLIENLEYSESKNLENVAIVIDTSGSTQGYLVKKFLEHTYAMISQSETQNRNFCLYLMQCDDKVTDCKKIENYDDFRNCMENFTLIGGGGTDFSKAFEYIDKKTTDKEMLPLKGLIYFTDGQGNFPKVEPPFKTAFVFYDDERNNYNVPSWAYKLIVDKEDLEL